MLAGEQLALGQLTESLPVTQMFQLMGRGLSRSDNAPEASAEQTLPGRGERGTALGAGSCAGMDTGVPPERRGQAAPHRTPVNTSIPLVRTWQGGCSSHHQHPRACALCSAILAEAGSHKPGSCLQGAPHPDVLWPFQGEMELTKSLSVGSVRESSLFFSICSCLPPSKPKLDASAFVF